MSMRAFTAGHYALELDGIVAGWVFSAEGGHPAAEVISDKVGTDHHVRKHIANIKYEDITVNCGMGMSKHFYQWIKDSFSQDWVRKNGTLYTCTFDNKIYKAMDFHEALVTEVGLPALDAASKDAAKLQLKIAPMITRSKRGSGSIGPSSYPLGRGQQKRWSPANFRLRIDGLDESVKFTNKIDAMVLKQKVVDDQVGELRDFDREPAALEIPNLVITLPEMNSEKIHHWFQEFVVEGNCSQDNEKTGTLEFLDPGLSKVLGTVTFHHLGIFKMTPDKQESASENIRRVKCEMYCEKMTVDFENGSTWI
jgi:hypothetical protein